MIMDIGPNFFNKSRVYRFLAIAVVGFLSAFLLFWNSIGEQKSSTPTIKSNKPFYNPQKLPKRTSTRWGALLSDPLERDTPLVKKDIKGPVQGKVTIIDWCSRTVFIDNAPFNMGSLDLTGVETGDRVKLTYRDTGQGKVIESIYVLR
jgi:hypothetical protein